MGDNRKFYDNLIKSGKVTKDEIGDFATFDSLMKTPANASILYNNLRKDDLFTEEEIGDSATFMSNIAPKISKTNESSTPIYPSQETVPEKKEWKDDQELELLKSKGLTPVWTSPYNYDKYLTNQFKETEDEINIKGENIIKSTEDQITQTSKTLQAEYDILNNEHKITIDKLNNDYDKALKEDKTPEERKIIRQKYETDFEAETRKYQESISSIQDKEQKEKEKIESDYTKNVDQLNKDIETYNTSGSNVRTKILDPDQVKLIQDEFTKFEGDYKQKEKLAEDIFDSIYNNYTGDQPEKLREEIYAVINEKLLFDDDGKISSYALKNQAEVSKLRIAERFNQLRPKAEALIKSQGVSAASGIGFSPTRKLTPEQTQIVNDYTFMNQAIRNYELVLNLPEAKPGKTVMGSPGRPSLGSTSEGGGFWAGWGSNPRWLLNTLTMGTINAVEQIEKFGIRQKQQRGEKLTVGEQELLNSSVLLAATTEKLKPGFSIGYEVGKATGKSLEWLVSMAATNPVYNLAKGAAFKAIGWQASKKLFGKNILKTMAGEVAGATARIPLQPSFASDLLERRTNVQPTMGEYAGEIKGITMTPAETFSKSFLKSAYSQLAENFSEQMGAYMGVWGRAGIDWAAEKYGIDVLMRVPKSKWAKAFKGFQQITSVSDPLSEYGEEIIANVLHLVDGSTTWKDVVDGRQNWITFLSVATMVAPMKTIQMALGEEGEQTIEDILNKDQYDKFKKILDIKDIDQKSKELTTFILDNKILNYEDQSFLAKYVFSDQVEQVRNDLSQQQTEGAKPAPKEEKKWYLYDNVPIEEEEAINKIEDAESISDLDKVTLPPDSPLEEHKRVKAEQINKIEELNKTREDAKIKAGENEEQIANIEEGYQKSLDEINNQYETKLQKIYPVKEETEEKLTEKKTEIPETQNVETEQVAESEQKKETVKQEKTEKLSKFDNLTSALNITKEQEGLEDARVGKVGKATVILSKGKTENEVVIESIKVPKSKRGKGIASKALAKVLDEADNQGLTVRLKAVPEEGAEITQQQLINWYKKNDFEFEEGKIEGVRKPHVIVQTAKGDRIDVTQRIKEMTAEAPNAAKSVVVEDATEIEKLSKKVKESNIIRDSNGRIEAIYDPNIDTAFFVKNAIKSEKDIIRLWAHEQGTHKGLRVLFPDATKRNKILLSVYNSVDWEKAGADNTVKPYINKFNESKKTDKDKADLAEEYLAKLAEKIIKKEDLTAEEKSIWQKFVDWFNKLLSDKFGDVTLTSEEIADIVKGSVKSLYAKTEETEEITEGSVKASIEGDEISFDQELGVIFLGGDMLHVDEKGNRVARGIDYARVYKKWAVSENAVKRLDKATQKSYKTIAIVAYPTVLESMERNKLFHMAIERALIDAYGKSYGKILLNKAEVEFKKRKDLFKNNKGTDPISVAHVAVGMQPRKEENKLLKDKSRVTLKGVAENIAVPNWQDIKGKIVGIGRYDGYYIDKTDPLYPGHIKFKSYYPLPKPIDFKTFIEKSDNLAESKKKGIWYVMRNLALWMNKGDNPIIPAMIDAGNGDISKLDELTDGIQSAEQIKTLSITNIQKGGTQNAEKVRTSTEKAGTEEGIEGREGGRLRVRYNEEDWLEAGEGEEIKASFKAHNPYEMRLNENGELIVAPVRSPHFANMTMDDKGNFVFFHRSPFNFDVIDPKKYGTNPAMVTSASEVSAIAKVGGLSMFYLNQNQSETMVTGQYHYAFAIPMKEVYDYDADPKKYKPLAEKRHDEEYPGGSFDRNTSLAYVTKIASENGYKITVTHWWADDSRAQTAVPLKVSDMMKLDGNTVVKKFDNDYIANEDYGYVPIWAKTKDQKLAFVYQNIYKEINARQLYSDPLYHLYMYVNYDFPKKATVDLPFTTQQQITDAVMSSKYLTNEIKEDYKKALNFKTIKGHALREGAKKIGKKILIPFEVKTQISSNYKSLYDRAKKSLIDNGLDEDAADIKLRDAIFDALQKELPEILKSEGITNKVRLTKDIGGYSGGTIYQINPNILVEFDSNTKDDVLVDVMNALNKASAQEMANAFRTPTKEELKNKDKDIFPTLMFERPSDMDENKFKSLMLELANVVDNEGSTPLGGFTEFDKFINISGYFYNKFDKKDSLDFIVKNLTKISRILQKYGVSLRSVNVDNQKVFSYNGLFEQEAGETDQEDSRILRNRPENYTREERLFQQASNVYNRELQKIFAEEDIKLSVTPDFRENVFDRIVKAGLLSDQQIKDLRDKLDTKAFSTATKEKQTLEIVKSLIKSSTGITKKTFKELGTIISDLLRGLSKAEKQTISPRQYISIIGRLGQANTVRTMKKLLDDVYDKYIFGDGAIYKAALAEARKALGKIVDANKTNTGKFGTVKETADEVSNIDLTQLSYEELKEFTKLTERIFKSKRTPSVEYLLVINDQWGDKQKKIRKKVSKIKDIEELSEFVDEASEITITDIDSYVKLNRMLNLARRRAKEIFSELADTEENTEEKEKIESKIGKIEEKGETIGGEFQEMLDKFRNAYADYLSTKLRSQETKDGIDTLETQEEKDAGMDLYSVPVSVIRQLDIAGMADLNVAINNLRIGELVPYTFHDIVTKIHAISKKDNFLITALRNISKSARWKNLLSRGLKAYTFSKTQNIYKDNSERNQLLFELMKLQSFRMDLFLGNTNLVKTIGRIFSDVGQAVNKMNALKSKTDEMIYEAYKIFAKDLKKNRIFKFQYGEDEQLTWRKILGMFMVERRWQASKYFNEDKLTKDNASFLNVVFNINKEESRKYASDSKGFEEDLRIYNQFMQLVRDNDALKKIGDVEVIDINKIEAVLRENEGINVLLTTLDKIFEDYRGMNRMAALFSGRSITFGDMFFPFRRKDNRNKIDDDNIFPEFMRVASGAKLQSGSTYQWTGDRMYIETDVAKVLESYTEGIRRNYFLYPLIRESTMALRMAAGEIADDNIRKTGEDNRILLLGNTIADALMERLAMYYKTGKYHKERKAFDILEKGAKKALLAKPAKLVTETTANAIRMFLATGEVSKEIFVRIRDNKEFYKEFVGEYIGDKYFSRWADEVNASLLKNKGMEFAETVADFLITYPDKSVGRALFVSYFTKKFKEITGEDFNEVKYQNEVSYKLRYKDAIDDAATLGLRRVEELFNNKNPLSNAQYVSFFNGIISMRADSGTARVFNFLMSFGYNESRQIVDSMRRYRWSGRGSKERLMAKRDILSVVSSNFLYGVLRKLTSIGEGILLAQVSGLFGHGGGDDDKYIDEQKQQIMSGKFYWDYATKRIAIDLILGGSTNIFESAATFFLHFLDLTGGLSDKAKERIYELYDIRYMDRLPLYGMANRILIEATPAGLQPITKDMYSLCQSLFDIVDSIWDVHKEGLLSEKDVYDLVNIWNIGMKYLLFSPAVPVFERKLNQNMYKLRSEHAKQEKKWKEEKEQKESGTEPVIIKKR